MLAERLARLLGSILALGLFLGSAPLLEDPPTFETTGYDWGSPGTQSVTVDQLSSGGSADSWTQVAYAPQHGVF